MLPGPRRINLLARDTWDFGSMRHGYRWRGASVGKRLRSARVGAAAYDLLSDEDRSWPYHFHHGMEEWLLVVDGTPTLRHLGGEWELKAGDLVCFPPGPQGGHQLRGPGTVLLFSANRSPEAVEYPDSGKIAIRPPGKILRAEPELDYWEGEEIPEGEPAPAAPKEAP
jgi:uncharacterized cupin superfamily protein